VVSATDPHGRNLGFLDPDIIYVKISRKVRVVVDQQRLLITHRPN
jgi:hypothetical protein